LATLAAAVRGRLGQPLAGFAALAAPLWLAASLGARRQPRAARARDAPRVVRCAERVPSRAAGATLKSRIWDMLGLHTRAGKTEIRQAYKEYVRDNHPDLNGGKRQNEKEAEAFRKLTAEYNRVMDMTDGEFWLESFDTGITRMATKRVDGPSLNPWERRFRTWARSNDLLEVDELADEDVDCKKKAELFLDCEEDPTAEGCETFGRLDPIRVDSPRPKESRPPPPPPVPGTSKAPERTESADKLVQPAQIFVGIVLAFISFIIVSTVAIFVSAMKP